MSRLDISLSQGWICLYSILQVGYISTLYSRLDISLLYTLGWIYLYPQVGYISTLSLGWIYYLSRLDISISLGWIYPIPRLDIYQLYTLGWIYLYSILQVGYISTLYSRLDIYIYIPRLDIYLLYLQVGDIVIPNVLYICFIPRLDISRLYPYSQYYLEIRAINTKQETIATHKV